ncbi:MAG: hypothetical protein IPO15_08260, partial [Anaerolineae bacterium]|nr:hypothetical protein [Anaerolineae bacterium]
MSSHHPLFRSLTIVVLIVLVLSPLQPVAGAWPLERGEARPSAAAQQPGSGVYRTTITWRNTVMQRKLADLGVIVLREESADSAIVLATAGQLEDLARLRFQPTHTDDAVDLVQRQDANKAWLAPAVERLAATLGPEPDKAKTFDKAIEVTAEQRAGLASLNSLDEDGDGLTNTEEAWWCTDPLNANSDGDAQAYSDGTEVDALLDFTLSRTVRWGYGPPFGPPNAWPNFNDRTGTHVNVCNDGDYDTIPDFAEVFVVGSRVPNETTDSDKFDDGQELFGVTYCPGAPTNCGYGSYPAIEYWNYIKATMPNWVRPPGDNIFVAAFPVPEVSVVPGSWTVNRVTTITTTQGQMTQQTNSYETSVMQGQSTSIADTRTWNNWEGGIWKAVERPLMQIHSMKSPDGLPLVWAAVRVFGPKVLVSLAKQGVKRC